MQHTSFTVDLYVLPISGANIVLGVHWLRSLGPIITYYNKLCMQFIYNGQLVTLQGDQDAHLTMLTTPQFRRLCRKQGSPLCLQLTALTLDPSPPDL